MFLLNFIPTVLLDHFINTILIVGIISSVVSFFFINPIARRWPAIASYYILIQLISFCLLLAGVFFKGSYYTEKSWRDKMAVVEAANEKLKEDIKESEEKSKKINQNLEAERKKKQKVIKDVQYVIEERIKVVEKKIDAECKVAPEAISILNDAAKNVKGNK